MTTRRWAIALFSTLSLVGGSLYAQEKTSFSLKKAFQNNFLIGTALNVGQVAGYDSNSIHIAKQHFNSIVAEDCMKSESIHPQEERFNFTNADKFVAFGEANKMFIVGHTLIWHSQLASWFCVDKDGRNVSPKVLKARMKRHISTIVGRYKGRIQGWDVVNEAIEDDGSWRKSKFYEILGEEYIELAFRYAHQADPNAELYYNDFNMTREGKRKRVVELVKSLRAKGVRIDAIGMQGHMGMDYPLLDDFEQSIVEYAKTGADVMVTEWDMSLLPYVSQTANVSETVAYKEEYNPYPNGLPQGVAADWNRRMKSFMDMFLKHSDKISRVTVWGVSDSHTWRNNWPIMGRRDYPLLFDRNNEPKPFLKEYLCPSGLAGNGSSAK